MALKILEADVSDPDALRRFEREREAMTALARHGSILTIIDAGVHEGRPWLAMELCRRGSLASYVADGGPLDVPTVLRVLDRLAGALAVAHDAGVVHCDIKPANVMLADGGEPALGDFGIARVSVGRATTTTVGGFSLDHVAPELLDDGKRSPRSDVYSLATTAWELLAGHPPFRAADGRVGRRGHVTRTDTAGTNSSRPKIAIPIVQGVTGLIKIAAAPRMPTRRTAAVSLGDALTRRSSHCALHRYPLDRYPLDRPAGRIARPRLPAPVEGLTATFTGWLDARRGWTGPLRPAHRQGLRGTAEQGAPATGQRRGYEARGARRCARAGSGDTSTPSRSG